MTVTVPKYGFPSRYDDNYLVLLVRDPHCIFGYWEFSNEQMDLVTREFGCSWGDVPLILRVYDLTGLNFDGENAHGYFDLYIHPLASAYYVKDIHSNRSYCVDLGVVTSAGRFVTLIRSNVVQTPRDSLADGSGIVMTDLLDRLMTGGVTGGMTGSEDKVDIAAGSFSSDGVYINS